MNNSTDNTAMGSPLSPVVANISMAIVSADYQPKVWFRHVDDTFVFWQHGRDNFLLHINDLQYNTLKVKLL